MFELLAVLKSKARGEAVVEDDPLRVTKDEVEEYLRLIEDMEMARVAMGNVDSSHVDITVFEYEAAKRRLGTFLTNMREIGKHNPDVQFFKWGGIG